MNDDVDECIRKKIPWSQLPTNVKQLLGDSHKEYERYVFDFSIKNQLRYRGSLVRTIRRDEKKYYEALVQCSVQRLMLFPYHLADMIVKGLRITPFLYYIEVVAYLMELEKSYDTMPNFTAADCLRLLGIGRNEYLELVAKARSVGRRGRSRAIRALLPKVPLDIPVLPWWRVELGYVLEGDVKPLTPPECAVIDLLIDCGSQTAGTLDYDIVKNLYRRGLVYLDVPVTGADRVSVPPLKGFVMNRITGDYFETLLYKVFVSIDEHTTVAELAAVLQVDCELVKQAVSLYCRVGFAHKLNPAPVSPLHPSWKEALDENSSKPYRAITPLTFDPSSPDELQMESVLVKQNSVSNTQMDEWNEREASAGRRVAFLFDSTLAAYLMMGNLSPDLKSHAVTLFEVGKLCDESLDSLLLELDKVAGDPEIEGEARRYLVAALCLRDALRVLRPRLRPLDLLRCEALHSLGSAARSRLMNTKYRMAISMAPLCQDARPSAVVGALPHLGPAPPEAATPWMRLYLYHVAGYGPPTLLLTKGTVLKSVPRLLLGYSRLLVTLWSGEAAPGGALPAAAALSAATVALRRGPVLLQAVGVRAPGPQRHVLFPREAPSSGTRGEDAERDSDEALWRQHTGLRRLARRLRLWRCCGYVTLVDVGVSDLGCASPPENVQLVPSRKKRESIGLAKPASKVSLSSSESLLSTRPADPKPQDTRLQSPNESHFAVTPTCESKTHSPANGFTSAECSDLLQKELDELEDDSKVVHSSEEDAASSKPSQSSLSIVEITKDDLAEDTAVPVNKDVGNLEDLLSPADESISMFSQLSMKLSEVKGGTSEEGNNAKSGFDPNSEAGDSGVDVAQNASDDENCRPEKWTILDLQFGVPLFEEELCVKVCKSVSERLASSDNLEKLREDNEFVSADLLKFVSQCQYYPSEDMRIVKRGKLVPPPRICLAFENGRISEWNGK